MSPSPQKSIFRRRWLWIIAALAVVYSGVKLFGLWGASQLECNTTELPAETLPGAGPLRIAFISDIHNSKDMLAKAVDMIEAAEPDLIVYGGDFIALEERTMRTRKYIDELRRLKAIAPTYAILGNMDYERLEPVARILETAGVSILRNRAVDWTAPNGSTIRIIGLGDWNEGDENPDACMKPDGQEEHPVLLISHDPESRQLLDAYDWDLMLSGHVHGGQIGIPFTRHFISFRSDMVSGPYPYGERRHVFVTRGVGSTWGIRFFCPPEVSIIDIK